MGFFSRVDPTLSEVAASLPGDSLVPDAVVVMDRAFSLTTSPTGVWPWFVQLGKNRAGWYFPKSIEWLFVKGTRGIRFIDPKLQDLAVGHIIDDWGGKNATFEVALLEAPRYIVHTSTRKGTRLSWAIVLSKENEGTRVQLRLRLNPVKLPVLARIFGGFFDKLTIAWLAAGLRERLR
jgi:hypothetical protein